MNANDEKTDQCSNAHIMNGIVSALQTIEAEGLHLGSGEEILAGSSPVPGMINDRKKMEKPPFSRVRRDAVDSAAVKHSRCNRITSLHRDQCSNGANASLRLAPRRQFLGQAWWQGYHLRPAGSGCCAEMTLCSSLNRTASPSTNIPWDTELNWGAGVGQRKRMGCLLPSPA